MSKHEEVKPIFLEVVKDYTAGSPQEQEVKWTNLTPPEIRQKLLEKDCQVSCYDARQLLAHYKFRRRKLLKCETLQQTEGRNEQFEYIALLKDAFLSNGLPVFSLDTKKKELLGNFCRSGSCYAIEPRKVKDHDFPSFADGKVVPHGVYDIGQNKGYLTLGTSHDTSAFVCDNLEYFWVNEMQWVYPDAEWMLLLCDGGGSNNCRHHIVKQDLWNLAQRLQINIMMAHYPPYCSKWNPIEHSFFCHVHRAWSGTVFENIQIVKELALKTSTTTGLTIDVRINEKHYEIKRKVNEEFKDNLNQYILFSDTLPQWNYSFICQPLEVIF